MTYDEWNKLHYAATDWWQTMRVVSCVDMLKPGDKHLREYAAERRDAARPGNDWWLWYGVCASLEFMDYVVNLEHEPPKEYNISIDTSREGT